MQKERVTFVLDKRYRRLDKTFPIRIEVTFQQRERASGRRVRRVFSTGHRCLEKEFVTITGKPRSDELREIKSNLDRLVAKARNIIEKNPELTVALFESHFFGIATDTLDGSFEKRMQGLKAHDRIGSAQAYSTALNSFKMFVLKLKDDDKDLEEKLKTCSIRFSEVSDAWLSDYQDWMVKRGKSINTIGIYLRSLRAVFNEAIGARVVPSEMYPFRTFKIRSERKFKIPLSDVDINKLKEFSPNLKPLRLKLLTVTEELNKLAANDKKNRAFITKQKQALENEISGIELKAEARDYFLFSYFCNGMNAVDMCRLRHSDIQDDFLIYDRSKTRSTKIHFKKIIIPIDKQITDIIKRRGRSLDPGGYVFPVLEENLSALTIKGRVQTFIRRINQALKGVASDLKFKKKLTTVIARHTFANRMSNFGADRRMIQEALGHQNSETTEHYLGTMDIQKIRKAREGL